MASKKYGWTPEQMARVNALRNSRGQESLDPGQVDSEYESRYIAEADKFLEQQRKISARKQDKESTELARKQAFWSQGIDGQKQMARILESKPSPLDFKVPELKFSAPYTPGQYAPPNNPLVGNPPIKPSSLIVGGSAIKPIDPQAIKSIASFNATQAKLNPAEKPKPNLTSKLVSPIKMFPWDSDSKAPSIADYSTQYYKKTGGVDPSLASDQMAPIKMFPDSLPRTYQKDPLSTLSNTKKKKNSI